MNKTGLQMYTLREYIQDNIESTLTEVKDIGYESIQLAGGIELMESTAKAAKNIGIPVIGIMANINLCETESDKLFNILKSCNATDIGIGTGAVTYNEVMEFVDRANKFAEIASKEGFTLSYHNHSHEFIRTENGQTVLEIYKKNLNNIFFMLDTYWIQHGGADVRKTIEDFKGKVKILHLINLT